MKLFGYNDLSLMNKGDIVCQIAMYVFNLPNYFELK